jgi:AAA family ATP:ADP antiporter
MRSLIDVRPGERRSTLLAMLFFFLILASYYLIRPVRDQLSGANGLKDLPLFYSAVLICMLLLTPVYGWLVARLPRARFIPLVYSFFIVCLAGFGLWFMYGSASTVLATSFFVWVSVFNLFVVAVFWSFMADLFSPEQSTRLFPLIAIGGSLGSLAGPLLTRSLVQWLGVGPLLLVGVGMLIAALLCALLLLRGDQSGVTRRQTSTEEVLIGGSLLAGARLVFRNRVVGALAGLMLLSDCIGGMLYALVAEHVRSLNLSAEGRAAFYSGLDLRTNLIALGLQLIVARPLLLWLGAGRTFALALSINFAMCVMLVAAGDPAYAVIALMITRSCAYGLQKPLLDGFYARVDRETRYKAKAFIDTVIWRFGDLAIVVGMSGLVSVGLVTLSKLGVTVYGLASATAAAGSGLLGWKVDRWTRPLAGPLQPVDKV